MGTSTSTIVSVGTVPSPVAPIGSGFTLAQLVGTALSEIGVDGRPVTTDHDTVTIAFDSAGDALRCGVALQQGAAREPGAPPLAVGIATGDVTWDGGVCSGPPVAAAAHLRDHAGEGRILISNLVRLVAGGGLGQQAVRVGLLELADAPEPVEVFELPWPPPVAREAGAPEAGVTVPLPAAMRLPPAFPFVGRDREVAVLTAAAETVHAGARRTVLIGGEAGAGKTRLAFELGRARHAAGATVLLGTCDAELALPYQPWVQVLGQLVRCLPPAALAETAGWLSQLTVLLPEIERLAPGIARPAPADPDTERYRLFEAVAGLLAWAGRDSEVVVVIDDLHWASAQSLALFRHLVRADEASELLLVATFRDTGDEVTPPLASCLADLRRVESSSRLQAGALDEAAVQRFVTDSSGRPLDDGLRSLAGVLTARSGGNAFYLGELWRHLHATGAVAAVAAGPAGATTLGVTVPDGVKEVVAARLARLDPLAREVVELIATAGLQVDLRVLGRAFAGQSLARPLDELVRAMLLVEIAGPPVVYQFAHALARDSIVQQASVIGRAERHRRIARAVELEFEPDHRPVLAELARHYVAAADLGEAEKAVRYARRAASQAMESNADEEAVVHLEAARPLCRAGGEEHIGLLLDLGTCRTRTGLDPAAFGVFQEAFTLARAAGLARQAALAAAGMSHLLQLRGEGHPALLPLVREAAQLLGPADDPVLQAELRTAEAMQLHLLGHQDGVDEAVRRNVAEARRSGQPAALLAALIGNQFYSDTKYYLDTTIEGCALAEQVGDYWTYCNLAGGAVRGYLQRGDLQQAGAWLDRLRSVASRGRYGLWRYQVANLDSLLALVFGRFDEAERLAGGAAELLPEGVFVDGIYGLQMYAVRREQGRLAEVAPVLRLAAKADEGAALWRPGLAALYAQVGMLDDARATFEVLARDDFGAIPRDSMWSLCLVFLSEIAMVLDDRPRAAFLYEALAPHAGYTLGAPFTVCAGPADRLRGGLAALLGRPAEARDHFAAALRMAEASGSPVWLARVQHDWAVALSERPDLLEEALATATRLGMADLARGAQRSLEAATAPPAARSAGLPPLPDGLSAREVEVLRLVAAGRSNRTIGEALFISPNTVANHVRSILMKTGTANRAEAAAYAAHRGLLGGVASP